MSSEEETLVMSEGVIQEAEVIVEEDSLLDAGAEEVSPVAPPPAVLPSSSSSDDKKKRRKNKQSAALLAQERHNQLKMRVAGSSKSSVQVSSVVKIFVKKVHACQTGPWKMSSESSCTGSGFILPHSRILTNAHVVHRGQSILVRAQSGSSAPRKWECSIESISLPLDLAVLKVTDERFFEGKPALEFVPEGFENLPHLDDNVTAVGFPTGGDQISVTRGVVSRITHIGDVLRVQIDAAINPGNSGGPVFNEKGKVVGVAAAHLKDASNIGYIIPSCVVHLFFNSTKDTGGRCHASARSESNPEGYCGVACLGINTVQTLENQTLRKYLGMQDREGGVRVVSVDALGGCLGEGQERLVQPDDVLLKVNGILIGQDGTVQLPGRPEERIHFTAIVTCQLPQNPIEVTLVRKGKLLTTTIIPKPRQYICPRIDGYDAKDPPLYLICGGCVFTPLTRPWLKAKKKYDLLLSYYGGPLTEPGRQVVMLSTVLASSINVGYHNLGSLVLRAFDNIEVFSLQHLAMLIQNSTNPLLEFRLSLKAPSNSSSKRSKTQVNTNGSNKGELKKDEEDREQQHDPQEDEILVILDRNKCKEMDPEIRRAHLIAAACSPDIDFNW
eukprot:CAMPEP_0172507302 /NCGR_PEP_ID=MMETSP1066-20121228/202762_1 /TAXON_ID=671091 /ORGANISM="Coscinodiscus wailesii, Strain CCMP2513" /LENGTH=612 /DNA_ID=CAMNT_0013284807 /DNA_START=109 /DNA_END=1947 /DNA_ORIENTATION=-